MLLAGSGDVEDVLLPRLHSRDVLVQGRELAIGLGAAVTTVNIILEGGGGWQRMKLQGRGAN